VTLDEFTQLEGLGQVKRAGMDRKSGSEKYEAHCPAHHDTTASLAIWEENGWIKLLCRAECSEEAILGALGLENKDLHTLGKDYAQPSSVYRYEDEWHNELFEVLRYPPRQDGTKVIKQRHLEDGEWVWNMEDVRRVPYRLPELLDGIKAGSLVLIVEGEKDVEAWREHGQVATCNPMGAGKWREDYNAYFQGAKVLIIADRDEPGRLHAAKVRDNLTGIAASIWIAQAKTGNDSYDHLEAGFTINDLEPYREKFRRGRVTSREMAELAVEDLSLRPADVPGYQLWPMIPLTFRQGRTYAVGAYTGDGKTSAGLQAYRNLSTAGRRVGYFSLEMPERDLRNKLIAHQGEIPLGVLEEPWQIPGNPQWQEAYMRSVGEIGAWDSDVVFRSSITSEEITDMTTDHDYEVVIVDHIHRSAWGRDRRDLEEQINKLTNLSLEQNIMVLLLCQLRKYSRGPQAEAFPRPTIQDFRETSMIGDDCSMALGIWRQRDDAGMSYTGYTDVMLFKNRHTTGRLDAAGQLWQVDFDVRKGMFTNLPTGVQESYGTAQYTG
jgi:hypothetical protein